ncbi:MAG TPA: PAS domain S-box protein [Blastocatellia bacterium]|nr:PAS domain S-box protein [Blastocatellia bacterium]
MAEVSYNTAQPEKADAAALSQQRLESLINAIDGIVWEAEPDTLKMVFVSRQAERILGYPTQQWISEPDFWSRHFHPEDQEGTVRYCRAMTDAGKSHLLEYRMVAADGRVVWFRDSATVTVAAGKVVKLQGIMTDITDRKQAEDAQRKSEARFRSIFESDMIGITFWATDGRILSANRAFLNLVGYTQRDLGGAKLRWDAITPDEYRHLDGRAVEQLRATGAFTPFEKEFVHRDGHRVPVILGGALLPGEEDIGVGFVLDASNRRRLEEQLRHAQKMEAIGRLAGGIAHDFNNLLTAILGYSELLLMQVKQPGAMRDQLEEVRKAGQRAAKLTTQLLAFSRKQILQPKALDLNTVVADMEKMLKRLIGEDIELKAVPAASLGRVLADPGQIEQVILNIAINARDAMPQGGKLTIETQNVTLSQAFADTHPGAEPGHYVMLDISDTGKGMDVKTLARIFEPFFTTKEQGKGTGLGLSTVYGIVKQSGGSIAVYSEPWHGTTFKIYLPRTDAQADDAAQESPSRQLSGGAERILLVEDDEAVRVLAGNVLREAGYSVLEASDGLEALRVWEQSEASVELVVTDMVMPQMNGQELARHLWDRDPQVKVLFMTGYTENAVPHQEVFEQEVMLMQKPFTPAALCQKVREALGNAHAWDVQ